MNTICCNQGNPLISADVIGINELDLWIFCLFVFQHFRDIFKDMISLKEQ